MSFPDALQRVKQVRPATRPNEGFILQLKAYGETLAVQFTAQSLQLSRPSPGDTSASDTDEDCGIATHEVLDGVLPEDRVGTAVIVSDCGVEMLVQETMCIDIT
jgi:hypothetical protein